MALLNPVWTFSAPLVAPFGSRLQFLGGEVRLIFSFGAMFWFVHAVVRSLRGLREEHVFGHLDHLSHALAGTQHQVRCRAAVFSLALHRVAYRPHASEGRVFVKRLASA